MVTKDKRPTVGFLSLNQIQHLEKVQDGLRQVYGAFEQQAKIYRKIDLDQDEMLAYARFFLGLNRRITAILSEDAQSRDPHKVIKTQPDNVLSFSRRPPPDPDNGGSAA